MKTKTLLLAAGLMIAGTSMANTATVENEIVTPIDGIEHTVTVTAKGTKLTIELTKASEDELMIWIYDGEGNKVSETLMKPKVTIVDIKDLEAGTYFYRMMTSSADAVVGFGSFDKE